MIVFLKKNPTDEHSYMRVANRAEATHFADSDLLDEGYIAKTSIKHISQLDSRELVANEDAEPLLLPDVFQITDNEVKPAERQPTANADSDDTPLLIPNMEDFFTKPSKPNKTTRPSNPDDEPLVPPKVF